MDTLRKKFGRNLLRLRRDKSGLSQEAFADKCGMARSYMSRLERGIANPSLDAIQILADALAIPVAELFVFEESGVEID